MADISVIEWIVYGLFAYAPGIMLIISMFLAPVAVAPKRSLSLIRSVWAIIGVVASGILATSGPLITFPTSTTTTTTTIINGSTGALLTNSTTIASGLAGNILLNEVWMLFHYFLFIVYIVFIITQMLALFESTD